MKRILFVTAFLYTAVNGFAQKSTPEKWDLLKCVQYALDHNITIKQQDIQAQIAALTYKQAVASQYPNLNLTSNLNLYTGRSIDRTTNQFTTGSVFNNTFSLQSNVDVFNWFSKKNNIAGNKYDKEAASASVDKLKNDISLNIAAAYLQTLLAKEQVNASTLQINLTRAQLDNTIKQVKAGSVPELNQVQLESQLATDSFNLISAQGTETQSLLLIKSLLNLDAGTPFDIVAPPVDKIPVDPIAELMPETVYALAVKNLPQQRVNNLRLLAAKKYADAAKGNLYPSISVGAALQTNYSTQKNRFRNPVLKGFDTIGVVSGSNAAVLAPSFTYSTFANPYFDQFSNNLNSGVGLTLSVPVFNGRQARTNWEKQKLQVQNLSLQQESDNLSLKQDVYKAYTDAMTALQKFNSSSKAVEATQKAYDFSQKRYNVGLLNTIDLIISQNNLFTARVNKLSAQYDYVFKMKVLEFYKGQGIKL